MNDPDVCRKLAQMFPKLPRRADIPDPVRRWHGGKTIEWSLPNGITIYTKKGTMGRVWAEAEDTEGHTASAYASNHKAAIRELIALAREYYGAA